MTETTAPPQTSPSETPAPTTKEVVAALTNSPDLSTASDEFTLGDRKFTLMFLAYDDQLKFLSYMQPILNGLMSSMTQKHGVSVPGIEITSDQINMGSLLAFCSKDLPEMARIVCAQTQPNITIDEVKRLGGDPFTLAGVVVKQVNKNQTIQKFSSFFAPMLMMWTKMQILRTASTTGTTQP